MMDEKKIEEAQENIFEDKFLFNGEVVIFTNDEGGEDYREEMYHDGQIKEAISLGAHWAIEQFLEELWHDDSEEPDKGKSDILTLGFTDDDAYLQFKDSILWQEESWRHSISRCRINQWAYLSDILPKQKGGEG